MNLKLSDWASIAEIVSGIAIVVTIVVLIFELRSNSSLLERQIELDRIDRGLISQESPELAEVLAKLRMANGPRAAHRLFMDEYGLTYVEADRFLRFARSQWQGFQADFLFGESDELTDTIPVLLGMPEVAIFWRQTSSSYDPEFVEFVNSLAIPSSEVLQ